MQVKEFVFNKIQKIHIAYVGIEGFLISASPVAKDGWSANEGWRLEICDRKSGDVKKLIFPDRTKMTKYVKVHYC